MHGSGVQATNKAPKHHRGACRSLVVALRRTKPWLLLFSRLLSLCFLVSSHPILCHSSFAHTHALLLLPVCLPLIHRTTSSSGEQQAAAVGTQCHHMDASAPRRRSHALAARNAHTLGARRKPAQPASWPAWSDWSFSRTYLFTFLHTYICSSPIRVGSGRVGSGRSINKQASQACTDSESRCRWLS
ncbi:hypothetical protein IWZ03DRAFT_186711 [Phyllosticta citriasiana]|uniref:Uncharacterized protein n=1 Tax=Phyllosticta citriasiana TaxID=595635 RepID=A0ABR1KLC4_9PEZI